MRCSETEIQHTFRSSSDENHTALVTYSFPYKDENSVWCCEITVQSPVLNLHRIVRGEYSFQALQLAFKQIRSDLETDKDDYTLNRLPLTFVFPMDTSSEFDAKFHYEVEADVRQKIYCKRLELYEALKDKYPEFPKPVLS